MDKAMALDGSLDLETAYMYSPTTTAKNPSASGGEYVCHLNDWSNMVDWDAISGGEDDFHDIIEWMMDEGEANPVDGHKGSDSGAATVVLLGEGDGGDDLKGLRSVHLLMAAAEALAGNDKSHELARVILVRLKELVSPTGGTNMERLAAYFAEALQQLLDGGGSHRNQQPPSSGMQCRGDGHRDPYHHNQMDVLAAFQLMQDMSPYVNFAHFTANQAILEAVTQHRRVHIVDYDIMDGIQWASLMQALVSQKDGPPAPHLMITALSRASGGRRSIGMVQETGRRLAAFAASIGLQFSFNQCRVDSDETFRPNSLKLVKGEALIMNCILHLTHAGQRGASSVASFLAGAKSLNPRLVTLAEEETGHLGDQGFVSQFMETLHHYSALYDSLEAGFPMQGRARALVERVFLGPRIAGLLTQIYRALDKAAKEEVRSWGEWLGGEMGFEPVAMSFANHCQGKLLIGLFNEGYSVTGSGINQLVLEWKSRPLLAASTWTCPLDGESE
ncbi:hypothetical protein MLD38_024633 [Melastoma candidum]|uniref:Uncharacterized protein n=1 Tax=Melastoma candidum TaxID=119954 RepID=A0ACB9NU84_9MYRT|nr:hypothetical protein MLD38_024633 [Melastoma candidum]